MSRELSEDHPLVYPGQLGRGYSAICRARRSSAIIAPPVHRRRSGRMRVRVYVSAEGLQRHHGNCPWCTEADTLH